MSWTYHAAGPKRNVAMSAIILACMAAILSATFMGMPILGIAGAAAIILSTIEAFTGCRFRLDDTGATRRVGLSLSAIEWQSVVRLVESDDGILLSPLSEPSKLDAFRGVLLVMPYDMRTSVRAYVLDRVKEDVRLLGFGTDERGNGEADRPRGGRDIQTETPGSSGDGA